MITSQASLNLSARKMAHQRYFICKQEVLEEAGASKCCLDGWNSLSTSADIHQRSCCRHGPVNNIHQIKSGCQHRLQVFTAPLSALVCCQKTETNVRWINRRPESSETARLGFSSG